MAELAQLSQGRAGVAFLAGQGGSDPALPALQRLLDPERLRRWWKERIHPDSPLAGCRPGRAVALRYRPGRRCTFRVHLAQPPGEFLYLKLYRKKSARRIGRLLAALPRLAPETGLLWPRLLDMVPAEGVLVLKEVPGTTLESLLEQGRAGGSVIRPLARGLVWFHRLHRLMPPGCLPVWERQDENEVLRKALSLLAFHAGIGARTAKTLLGRLQDALETAPFSPPVLLHRDLHPQQILLERKSTGLVDLDHLALGAPEIDLGNLLAHLDLAGLHLAGDANHFALAADELAVGYARQAPLARLALEVARGAALFRLAAIHGSRPTGAALLRPLLRRARRCLVG